MTSSRRPKVTRVSIPTITMTFDPVTHPSLARLTPIAMEALLADFVQARLPVLENIAEKTTTIADYMSDEEVEQLRLRGRTT